ncbi:hypothetical protein [Sinorhizobium saheli]|uniref:hypothetical protein n=1 Tax=Sinorhizobium saheli TaxID=36856 RepID=UPI000833CC92|nr:hypothetical protein [Sinorhizobium saheli]MQW89326.1 hypothetical protein [Sinorhizobium saheli]
MSDAFICDAVRTPIGRYGGVLPSVRVDGLAFAPARAFDVDSLPEAAENAGEDFGVAAALSIAGEKAIAERGDRATAASVEPRITGIAPAPAAEGARKRRSRAQAGDDRHLSASSSGRRLCSVQDAYRRRPSIAIIPECV